MASPHLKKLHFFFYLNSEFKKIIYFLLPLKTRNFCVFSSSPSNFGLLFICFSSILIHPVSVYSHLCCSATNTPLCLYSFILGDSHLSSPPRPHSCIILASAIYSPLCYSHFCFCIPLPSYTSALLYWATPISFISGLPPLPSPQ